MKLSYLKEFVLLAQLLNFSATAERLYLTQPVLSRHISALEGDLGIKLFHRLPQGVALTDSGQQFLVHVRTMLEEYDTLCSRLRLREEGYDGLLRVGLPYYSMNGYLGKAPMRFAQAYPRIRLSYLTNHPDQIIHALYEDEVDLLIIARYPFAHTDSFLFHDLFQEPLSVLLPSAHPLACQSSVPLEALKDEIFLGSDTNFFSCHWALMQQLCSKRGFQLPPPLLYNQFESVLIAVQQGTGLVVEGLNLHSLPGDGLAALPLEGADCSRTVSIVYKESNPNPAISMFIHVFDQALKEARQA